MKTISNDTTHFFKRWVSIAILSQDGCPMGRFCPIMTSGTTFSSPIRHPPCPTGKARSCCSFIGWWNSKTSKSPPSSSSMSSMRSTTSNSRRNSCRCCNSESMGRQSPYCNGAVHVCGSHSTRLRDMPVHCGTRQELEVAYHRYRCLSCARTFSEEIPFKHPETRITDRAASWISAFLRYGMPISTVQRITGVHWDTIKRIQKEIMDDAVAARRRKLLEEGYKPRHLAVDEFAIHKGHRLPPASWILIRETSCGSAEAGRKRTSPSSSGMLFRK